MAQPRGAAATTMAASVLAAIVAVMCVGSASAAEVQVLHGSGTTNPSKFFWKLMDLLEERSKTPVSMTYRAVGRAFRGPYTPRHIHLAPRHPDKTVPPIVTHRSAQPFPAQRPDPDHDSVTNRAAGRASP